MMPTLKVGDDIWAVMVFGLLLVLEGVLVGLAGMARDVEGRLVVCMYRLTRGKGGVYGMTIFMAGFRR